jgi:hypothetical protein
MATRMQQRRGTASQWTTANPILAAGEIGFETDTNQFKMGDGTNTWSSLSYFKNLEDLGSSLDDYVLVSDLGTAGSAASLDVNGYIPVDQLGNILGDAPEILDTLEELAGALTATDGLLSNKVNTKAEAERIITTSDINTAIAAEQTARTEEINSIVDTQLTQARSEVTSEIGDAVSDEALSRNNAIAAAISDEVLNRNNAITTAIGEEVLERNNAIADSASLVTGTLQDFATTAADEAYTTARTDAEGYVSTHSSDTTNVHGISDTAALATKTGIETLTNKTISTADNTVTINLSDVVDVTASVSEVNILDGATVSTTELNYVDGVTSAIQTQLDAKAPLADPTFTGTATTEALTITGNLTVGGTTTTVNATDLAVSDPLIYLASEQYAEDVLDVGFLAATGEVGGTEGSHKHSGLFRDVSDNKKWKLISNVQHPVSNIVDLTDAVYDTLKLGGVEFADGVQVKQGVPSLTEINQKTSAYTTVLTDRDKLVEVSSATGVTLTIPTNASVAYPVGTSIDVLQTSTGQVTIAGADGVTVNSTPGLKLRTQWSSATLFKRAENTWVVYGDLSA